MRVEEQRESVYPWWVRLIFWAQRRKYGAALVPTRIWGRAPKLLWGLQSLYRAIDRKGSPIDPALRSLVTVRVSQINHCAFCIDINSSLLLQRGVPMAKALAVGDYATDAQFSARERAALDYAEAMTRSDRGVDAACFAQLRAHFSEAEAIELTAVIAYQNLSSKFNAALDIPPQGFCQRPTTQKN